MDPYNNLLNRFKQQHIPYIVIWELTHRCNLSCFMCYNVHRPEPELTTNEAFDVLDQMAKAGVLRLTLTGGEILLRSDFFDIARYARKLDFALHIKTNGTLITPTIADKIAELHPTSVDVSLLGATPETVHRIMGTKDAFRRIINGVQMLRQRNVHVQLNTLLMKLNLHERQDIIDLAKSMGASHQLVFKISPDDMGRDKSHGQQIGYEEMVALYGEMCAPFERRSGDPSSRTCSVGLHSCLIDPYGTVFPCVELRIPAGNLRTQSFIDIWQNAAIFQELRERHTLANLPVCRTCALQPYCEGRCAGIAWKETGNLYAPHKLACLQARARKHSLHSKVIGSKTLSDAETSIFIADEQPEHHAITSEGVQV